MHLHRLPGGEAAERIAKRAHGHDVADQRLDVHDAVGEHTNGGQEGVAQGKAAQDCPIVAEQVIRADLHLGVVGRNAELEILAARAQIGKGVLDHGRDAGGVHHHAKAARGDLLEIGVLIRPHRHDDRGAQCARKLHALRLLFDHHDLRRAVVAERLQQQHPHRPAAQDQQRLAGQDAEAFHGVHDAGQRLDESRLLVAHAFRQQVAGAGGHVDVFGKAAGPGDAYALPVGAVVGLLVAAEITVAAIEVGVYRHALAHTEVGHVTAHLDDHPAELVAGNEWEVRHIFVAVDVHIRAADAAA